MLTSATPASTVVLLGPESAGKTALLDALSERRAQRQNLRGATVSVQRVRIGDQEWVDTPGLLQEGATDAARRTLDALDAAARSAEPSVVLLVAPIATLATDLALLLPLVRGRRVAVAATFVDRAAASEATDTLDQLARAGGVPVVGINARQPQADQRANLTRAVRQALPVGREGRGASVLPLPRVSSHAKPGMFDRRLLGPLLGLLALLAPAGLATWAGLVMSGALATAITPLTEALRSAADGAPWLVRALLVGDYGAATMLPLLFIWTLPIVLLHATLTAVAKASGVLDHACVAVEPLVRPFGLTGRDVARVVMGYGCNVPAIVQGRSCLSCTRKSCSAAIAFGSACSYQLCAVLAVTSAAGHAEVVPLYLALLLLGALACARWTAGSSPRAGRLLVHRAPIAAPSVADIVRELTGPLLQILNRVIPIFLGITLVASTLAASGVLDMLATGLGPLMSILGLPAAVAPVVAAATVRKDGILLLSAPSVLATLSPASLLATMILASTVLPCAVTVLTLAREHGPRAATGVIARGTVVSLGLTSAIAWAGYPT